MTLPPKPLPSWFWDFCRWRDAGGVPNRRPASIPVRIPAWAWARYILHKGVVKPAGGVITSIQSPATYIMFCAGDALNALQIPLRYRVALSADRNQPWITQHIVDTFRAQGRKIDAWCDCDQTPPEYAIAAVRNFKLDGWIGQGETYAQFHAAYAAGATRIIGNLGSLVEHWSEEERQAILTKKVLFIQEDYWNTMPWLTPDWHGYPVSSSCVGIYDASSEQPQYGRYVPLATYKAAGRFPAGSCVYFNGGMREGDWPLL